MNKLIFGVLLAFVVSTYDGYANPIIWSPLMISELHIDQSGQWTIELYVSQDPVIVGDSTLDNFRIITKSDTALFRSGIPIHWHQYIIITNDNLQSPLEINTQDELIKLEENLSGVGWSPVGFDLMIGTSSLYNCVPPVIPGQSVHLLMNYINMSQIDYCFGKSNISNLGVGGYWSLCKGILQGFIYDAALHPVPENAVRISCDDFPGLENNFTYSDEQGSFNISAYSRNYKFYFTDSLSSHMYCDTILTIEPDSNNYFDLILDTIFTGTASICDPAGYSLKVMPNPVGENSVIIINTPLIALRDIWIKIYNEIEEIIQIIPVNQSFGSYEGITIPFNINNYNLQPGIYLLTLEMNGKNLANSKIVVVR